MTRDSRQKPSNLNASGKASRKQDGKNQEGKIQERTHPNQGSYSHFSHVIPCSFEGWGGKV